MRRVAPKAVAAVGVGVGLQVFGAKLVGVGLVPFQQGDHGFFVDGDIALGLVPVLTAMGRAPIPDVLRWHCGRKTKTQDFAIVADFIEDRAHLVQFGDGCRRAFWIQADFLHAVFVVIEELHDGRDAHGVDVALVFHLIQGRRPKIIQINRGRIDIGLKVGQRANRGVADDPSPAAVGIGRRSGRGRGDDAVMDFAPRDDDVFGGVF